MKSALPHEIHRDIASHHTEIANVCRQLGVRRLELFGSAVRGDVANDFDFVADLGDRPPSEYARVYFQLHEHLTGILAHSVDLVTPPGLQNPYLRQRVDQEKLLLYAA